MELNQPGAEASHPTARPNGNGVDPELVNGHAGDGSINAHELLQALQAMRAGDFSVRMPSD